MTWRASLTLARQHVHHPWIAFVVAFLPLATLAIRHTVDVPSHDQLNWNIVNLVEEAMSGQLSWSTLFLNHNEHQLIFTKLVIALNALLAHWYRPVETLLSATLIASAAAMFSVYVPKRSGPVAVVAVALVVASLNQWISVTWGFMLQHGVALVAAMLMAAVCSRQRISVGMLAATALAGTLASRNGLVLWVVGFLMLTAQALRLRTRTEWLQLAGFFGVAVLSISLYLGQLKGPPLSVVSADKFFPGLFIVLANPLATLVTSTTARMSVGAIMLVLSLVMLLAWLRQERDAQVEPYFDFRPLAAIVLFSLGSALMIALRREGETLLDVKYNTTINPLFAAIFVAGLGTMKQQKIALGRYLSVGVGGLFVAASLTSLATAALTERLERANAVADYADAAAAKASGFAVGHAVWRNLEHPDLATQFDRLNKLGLLRPDLDKFSDAVQNQLVNLRLAQRPMESPGLKVSSRLELPLALEVVGSPGRDQRGRLPDAVLLLVLPWNGADSVTVYPVAKTSQRDYNGSWWDRHSFGYLSERFDLMRPPDEVERFALIAVWLDSLQMTVLARSILSVRPTPHASVAHDRLIETPPSTSIAVPVVNDEASPAR